MPYCPGPGMTARLAGAAAVLVRIAGCLPFRSDVPHVQRSADRLIAQTRRRTVCGMLLGTGLERVWHHARCHRLFSTARKISSPVRRS
jgi:hypothetical protein